MNIIMNAGPWKPRSLPIEKVIETCLLHLQEEAAEVAVVLTDAAHIQQLNRDYRGQDKPTNVLSFPSDEVDEWGDILLAYEVIAAEAEDQHKSFEAHFTHLLVHGMLHLVGYDHEEDRQAEAMEALEIAILAKLAVANPYETS